MIDNEKIVSSSIVGIVAVIAAVLLSLCHVYLYPNVSVTNLDGTKMLVVPTSLYLILTGATGRFTDLPLYVAFLLPIVITNSLESLVKLTVLLGLS